MEHLFPDHPDEDTLELYALYRLPSQQEQDLEQHVLACQRCQQMVIRLARQAQWIRAAFTLSQQPRSAHEPTCHERLDVVRSNDFAGPIPIDQ